MRRHLLVAYIGASALLALAACSGAAGSGSGGASGGTIKVGVLADVTGALATGHDVEDAVKARFALQNAEGGVDGKKLSFVVADTTSTFPGALSAAQTLVEHDHVFGVIGGTEAVQGAVNYLKEQNVPLMGYYPDSPDFGVPSFTNMFSVDGSGNPNYLAVTTFGKFFKSQGVTSLAGVSYADAAGTGGLKATLESAQSVGLKVAYENNTLPIGTTDVEALALSIKASGANGIYLPVLENTSIALLTQLKEDGVHLKAALLIVGYGEDTLGSPPAVSAAQGDDFLTIFQPAEANTPATRQMVAALRKYAGETGDPYTFDYQGWAMASLFIRGLQAAGSNPTQGSFISGLRKVTDWNDGGLLAEPVDFKAFGNLGVTVGPGNCFYVAKLEGNAFRAITSANPVCGASTGQTVG
ncbi:MAG TPA: ABC transporter substrate-binding protein [Streptosporangiaceae bacterium]|nr:ABC transporter substrate-binding protein [Streptosporangiaceae bacterium]